MTHWLPSALQAKAVVELTKGAWPSLALRNLHSSLLDNHAIRQLAMGKYVNFQSVHLHGNEMTPKGLEVVFSVEWHKLFNMTISRKASSANGCERLRLVPGLEWGIEHDSVPQCFSLMQ